MNYTIRKAYSRELDQVLSLLREELITCDGISYGIVQSTIKSYVEDEGVYHCFVAAKDYDVIGFITIMESPTGIYIDDFGVTTSERNKGVGTSLIAAVENFANSKSVTCIHLHVNPNNLKAIRLYERLNFKTEKYEGNRFLMTKDL